LVAETFEQLVDARALVLRGVADQSECFTSFDALFVGRKHSQRRRFSPGMLGLQHGVDSSSSEAASLSSLPDTRLEA
jgi:hypothetical protein